nr:hypothetical protein [Tanacetum cinerariifolium]
MAFLFSPGSTNEVNTASIQVSVVGTPISTVSFHDNTANLSYATMYVFLANQPNGSQLVHEDLEQIHKDDLEEIDLKWSDTASYDKTKVECFNCHKMGHFARECRSPKNQESRPRNQDKSRKTVNVEDTSSKAMVVINGAGFDWSYMVDDEVLTNMDLMAFSDSDVQNSKTCSNTSLKSFETLKTQYDNLRIEFNKSEFDLATYKRGLAFVEEQLVLYKKNEVVFYDQIVVLKRDASFRDSKITALNLQIEKLKKEKESNQIKIDNYENASKRLDKLIGSQITDNSRTGLGFTSYKAITPPPTGLFAPSTIDLSNFGLEEFQHPEFKGYGPKDSKSVCVDTSNDIKKALDAPIIKVRNFAPTAVLTKSGIVPISTARQSSSRAVALVSATRPINTAAYKPLGAPQDALKDYGCFDSGCSRHMTGNISYLTDFKEHDRGYVAFGGGAKGGKITGKGTIRTATKDETSRILKSFITKIENLVEKKVKIIRCDNRIEFKNRVMNEFCEEKGNKREYSVARTPQQNRVVERRTRTLIEATRTMVLLVKPYFKTPYELFKGRSPALSFMRPFGCHVTILNTLDQLGKFDGKLDEGIIVGYSKISKAFRVYNIRTRKVEETLHIIFLENKPMIAGTNSNDFIDNSLFDSSSQALDCHNKNKQGPSQASESDNQERPNAKSGTKTVNTARPVNTTTPTYANYPNDPLMPNLEDARIFSDAYDDKDEDAEADYNNLETVISVSPISSARIHKDHLKEDIIREVNSAVQTRKMAKHNEVGLISFINKQRRANHKDFQNYLFAFFLSQMEPQKVTRALDDESWVEAMQEELLQFKLLNVWWIYLWEKEPLEPNRSIETRDIKEELLLEIKPGWLFMAYASFMDFTVYQMDVKSAFLYGTIVEEVYVSQPPSFVDPEFPDRVGIASWVLGTGTWVCWGEWIGTVPVGAGVLWSSLGKK